MGICVSCRRRDLQAPDKRAGGAGGGRVPAKGAAAELLPRRVDPAMANSISNIKMTNPIKGIVSKRRKRYIKDGFNLDLAYITDRLIAMGFPAEKLEGVYRNHIDEVFRFLEQMHKDHYKIYNLCSERCYDSSKFHGRVARYAFEDHAPPNMELIPAFCEDVHTWLSEDPRNVAAVHCKAGKGRTGTMVCCYLLYSRQKATADEALKFYGTKRTHDEKGVTIPSQRRYVEYYAALVRNGLQYTATKLHIREVIMSPPPSLNGGQCTLELTVSQAQPPLKAPAACHEVRKHDQSIRVVLEQCTPLHGDVRVDVYHKPKMMRKEKLFHFWVNTFFVASGVGAVTTTPPSDSMNLDTFKLTLNKWQLDDAHKDKLHKIYSADFKVEVILQRQPESSRFSACGRAPSPPSSTASDTTDPDPDSEHWDSGETKHQPDTTGYMLLDEPDTDISPTSPLCLVECLNVCPHGCVNEGADSQADELCPHGYKIVTKHPTSDIFTERFQDTTDGRVSYAILTDNDVEMTSCSNCIRMDFSNCDHRAHRKERSEKSKSLQTSPIKTMENAGILTKDGYMLIDRTPRLQKEALRLSEPTQSRKEVAEKCSRLSDPTGSRKCKHSGILKDGYMLVDATPRPPLKDGRRTPSNEVLGLPAVTNMRLNSESIEENYMEFNATDGYMKAVDQTKITNYADEYALMCPEMSNEKSVLCHAHNSKIIKEITENDEGSPEACFAEACSSDSKPGKNKKHSFFKKDDYKNDKGKIPKVSSDHTISDESKKKYNFFQRRDEEGSRPKFAIGDMRASWREFTGKFTDNRKKKDRDDSS